MKKNKISKRHCDVIMSQLDAVECVIRVGEIDPEFNIAVVDRSMAWCWDTYQHCYSKMNKKDRYTTTVQIIYVEKIAKEFLESIKSNPNKDEWSRAMENQHLMEWNSVDICWGPERKLIGIMHGKDVVYTPDTP